MKLKATAANAIKQAVEPPEPTLTLEDLLSSESEVLRRVARDANMETMAGHYSQTSGHNSAGSHSSHSSAKRERPLDD